MERAEKTNTERRICPFNLGTFGGYSFRDHCPFRRRLTADEVINWDEAKDGSAWFWPRGDHFGISTVVGTAPSISPRDLLNVIEIVQRLGGVNGHAASEHFGLAQAATRLPSGVICLLSALVFHGLTTQSPHEVWIAWIARPGVPQGDILRCE